MGGWSRTRTAQTPIPRARIPQERNPRAVPSAPANSAARAETPILRSTYLGQAELSAAPAASLSFLPPSPSSSCWLPPGAPALASGGAAAQAGSPWGRTAARPRLRRRRSGEARASALAENGPRSAAGAVPGSGLEGAVSAPRLLPSPRRSARVPHPPQPQVHPAGEEVQGGTEGGARPGGASRAGEG